MSHTNFFRASVGAVIVNDNNDVLACERMDVENAWQFPQGGIDGNESPDEAIHRELGEEIGIDTSSDVELVAVHSDWLVYELPQDKRSARFGRGQAQKWFAYTLTSEQAVIDLARTPEQEFRQHAWMPMSKVVEQIVDFRQPVYQKLYRWLQHERIV